jgi:hypothetical protein
MPVTNHVTIHTLRKYQRCTGIFARGSTVFMTIPPTFWANCKRKESAEQHRSISLQEHE